VAVLATILAALFAVLTLASSASAECAWVLWLRMEPERGLGNYAVFRAFGNQRECEKYVRDVKGSEQSPATWLCLPDTMDPRGAKR